MEELRLAKEKQSVAAVDTPEKPLDITLSSEKSFMCFIAINIFSLCLQYGIALTFYEHHDFRGHGIKVQHSGGCFTFPPEWDNRISSIDTANQCTPSHQYIGEFGFNDIVSAFSSCSGGGSSVGQGGGGNDIQRAGVEEHNKYRRRHGSPDLSGDDSLQRRAQKHADFLAANDRFDHSGYGGENIAANPVQDKVGAVRQAVKQWYDEVHKYDFNRPGFSSSTGHFTAVVWRNTRHVGIGIAWNPKKRWWVIVANYSPPGNVGGQYHENVRRPS